MYRLSIYRDGHDAWRWSLTATNGRIVADCGEGYRRKVDCTRMAMRLFAHLAPVVTSG